MIELGLDKVLNVRFSSNLFLSKLLRVVELYITTEEEINSIRESNTFAQIANLIESSNATVRIQEFFTLRQPDLG